MPTATRFAIVEIATALGLDADPRQFVPFVAGLAHVLQLPTLRLRLTVEPAWGPETTSSGARFSLFPRVGLSPAERQRLRERLEEEAPSHVLLVGALPADLEAAVGGWLPRARVFSLAHQGVAPFAIERTEWLLERLGHAARPDLAGFLAERALPDFEVDDLQAGPQVQPHVTLLSGASCAYRRPLATNPMLADVADAEGSEDGCSFCRAGRATAVSGDADPQDLAAAQLESLRSALLRHPSARPDVTVFDPRLFLRADAFFSRVLAMGLPPLRFAFSPRLRELPVVAARLRDVAGELAAAGHTVSFHAIGVETLSEEENLRYNKGAGPADFYRAVEIVRALHADLPAVFGRLADQGGAFSEFQWIVFSPWTRLADVRRNLQAGFELGFGTSLGWMISVLRLHAGMPIARLAEREGDLLVDAFDDVGLEVASRRTSHDPATLLPWRFRDPGVAAFFHAFVRVVSANRVDALVAEAFRCDALFARLAALAARCSVEQWPSLRLGFALLDRIEAQGPSGARDDVVAALADAAVTEVLPESAEPPGLASWRRLERLLAAKQVSPTSAAGARPRLVSVRLEAGARGPRLELELQAGAASARLSLLPPGSAAHAFFDAPGLQALLDDTSMDSARIRSFLVAVAALKRRLDGAEAGPPAPHRKCD